MPSSPLPALRHPAQHASIGLGAAADRVCLDLLRRHLNGARCEIRLLWNGLAVNCSETVPVATITIHDRLTLFRLVWRPDPAFGEAYTDGTVDVSGDLTEAMESVNLVLANQRSRRPVAPPSQSLAHRIIAARRHVHHHYDLGNEFFKLWLDSAMVYTCAYYATPDMTLEQAQEAKLEYVCRKVDLRPGDRVIEAGGGWGALAIHMAKRHGVSVRSYNISREQIAYARDRAIREGVADRVEFIDGDFRSIRGSCDVFVSIGMVEHIGDAAYDALGAVINTVLDPDHGRGLLHFIGRNRPMKVAAWTRRYVFPGTHVPPISEISSRVFEPWNLSTLDIENLRLHYAATLRDWRWRFDAAAGEVRQMFDERFVRMWRFYLSGAEAAFRSGDMQLFQVTFARPLEAAGRWTRADLYARPLVAQHPHALM